MENESILTLKALADVFTNECDDRVKSKLLEIEEYLLGIDIKNLELKDISIYYEILSRMMMNKNSEKTSKELARLTDKLMSKE